MTQRNQVDGLPTNSTEENDRQPATSGDNDESFEDKDEICRARTRDLTIPTTSLQSATAENPSHLEPTLEQSDDEMNSNMRTTSQRGGPGANGGSRLERTSLEVSASAEPPSHSNENAADGVRELYQVGAMILDKIREKLLFELGAVGAENDSGLVILRPSRFGFSIMVKRNKKVDLVLTGEQGPLPDEVADAIRSGWPQNRNVKGIQQLLLESDGTMPVSKVPCGFFGEDIQQRYDWFLQQPVVDIGKLSDFQFPVYDVYGIIGAWMQQKVDRQENYCQLENYKKEQDMFSLDQLASVLSYEEAFLLPPSKSGLGNTILGYDLHRLLSFLHRDFQSGLDHLDLFIPRPFIQFQLRYFRPIDENHARKGKVRYPCFLGDRQRAIIRRDSAEQYLEEKRARVTLRVSRYFPGLFNIVILTDDNMFPREEYWSSNPERGDLELNWARYGLKPCGKATAITHYMIEVSRVLERSLDAWSNALDSIDNLVHVNLSDFEDKKRVEALMFDSSFTRSKDYFVAIQLLRIMDEWLDELLLGIDDLGGMPARRNAISGMDAAEDNINVVTKNMKERATRFQNRVRKKSEEIKSLRDGLFNATSLREATKAMALNQAIYVFTVVTVLFTPVSFLATFWALPFLNNPAEEGSDMIPEPSSFRTSFIAMPLLTYSLVIGVAWYMRPDQSSYGLPGWLTGIWDTTREALRSAWNSFPHQTERTGVKARGGSDAGGHV
ncbi:hypothetical protein LCI18_001360 [Fusarium solani-melongenae]|uniref:Uncharacterized protein n=1 Tax=Fusarium solani subsp. cucurbitae TaxID=2747967 RepID=A0ACD3YNB4_FUSSC|nr:hypothetical protein LCI18_001360 [Fusarium solani-melongenae]